MSKFQYTREHFIPAGSIKVTDKSSGAIAYIFANSKGYPAAMGFAGKAMKPTFCFRFRTDAERERHVREFFAAQQVRRESKEREAGKRDAANTLVVGDILVSSCGYEQTNLHFYQVTASSGQFVVIRAIGGVSNDAGDIVGTCRAHPGRFIGEGMRKRVHYGDQVRIASYAVASKWDGRDMHYSSYH